MHESTSRFSSLLRYCRHFSLLIVGLSSWILPQQVHAEHIAGAELVYDCVGAGAYRINLTLFRDCASTGAQFDSNVTLFMFDAGTNAVFNTVNVPVPSFTPRINPPNWNACVGTIPPFCVEVAEYTDVLFLPPNVNGYYIAWARCCRNNAITNLLRPGCEGVTFLAEVPGTPAATCNSMPKFNNFPPLFLCASTPFSFDHSATDVDGDSLVYEITSPYTGLNTSGVGAGNNSGAPCPAGPPPSVGTTNPMGPAPYANVLFAPGHSALNPFGAGSIQINRSTGFLQAEPLNPGIYVLAISVKEYRNGVYLSENKRDFQFHVVSCLPQGNPPQITHNLSGLTNSNDTIFITGSRPFCYDFVVNDSSANSNIAVTPVSLAFGGNGGFPPPYATLSVNGNSPPVNGTICWETSCAQVGQTIDFIITARDTNDCPNYNIVFDTIYVTVLPSPGAPPAITYDLSLAPGNSPDTITANVQESFCFDFQVIDTVGDGNLASLVTILDSNGIAVPIQPNFSTSVNGDTLNGSVCFNTGCFFGNGYQIIIQGLDEYQCPPLNSASDTIIMNVIEPTNPAPEVGTDLLANPVNGDTILANVHEDYCFNFTIADTSVVGADSLYFSFRIEDLSNNFSGQQPTFFSFSTGDSLQGEICWTPRCVNVDGIFRVIVTGHQVNFCGITNTDVDTVYFRVSEPSKPAPVLTHDTGPSQPGNSTINIEDNDTLCFAFSLVDVATPTLLSLQTEVTYANGAPYFGGLPAVNYTTQSDSVLLGNICWEIPCGFLNESFKIRLIGRDTFDCHPGNVVYDSVWVNHTETIPDDVDVCRVTVAPGNTGVLSEWLPVSAPDLIGYAVLRRRADQSAFTAIDTVPVGTALQYLDATAEVNDFSYCYSIVAVDRCGNISQNSETACTILLSGEPADYSSELSWTAYSGFTGGVSTYEVLRNFPHLNSGESVIWSVPFTGREYVDSDISEGQTCYRIRANESGNGCGVESYSNEICVEFPPIMYVPSAFTPNGDQLNDNFNIGGAFIQRMDMQIYDRWGKLLYQTADFATGWNGKIAGRDAPEGVYIFRITVTGFDGKVLNQHGSVTLLR